MANFFRDAQARAEANGTLRRGSDKKHLRNEWQNAFKGVPGSTPLSEFQSNKNTRYARDVVGWDKAQGLRRAAEAEDAANPMAPPPGKGQWEKRYNYVADDMEWLEKTPGNYWKANKNELMTMAAMAAGGLILGPGGMLLAKSLTDTGKGIYEARKGRREFQDQKREFDYAQAQEAQAQEDARRANMGNLFRSGGEGVIEYATKDIGSKKRDQYVRRPYRGA